jgi:hypothetical protein
MVTLLIQPQAVLGEPLLHLIGSFIRGAFIQYNHSFLEKEI